jgi:type IV pilus assembly protein PilO
MISLSFVLALFLIEVAARAQPPAPPTPPPLVIGYYADWTAERYPLADIPAGKLTHVNYAFGKIGADNRLVFNAAIATERAYPGDCSEPGCPHGLFNQITLLKQKQPHLKFILSVGGWTDSGPFYEMAATDPSRQTFAQSCADFLKAYPQFDGIDIDWEHAVIGGLQPGQPRDAHNYVLLLAAILGVAYFFDWQSQLEELDAGKALEVKLKDEYKSKKTQAVNLDLLRAQLRDIETSFGALLKQLPNRSQMEALLVDINQAGLGRGLQFELFRPAPSESQKDFYAELPITIKVTGNYHDMGSFASDIGQLPRIVTLNDISLNVGKEGNLTMDTTAKTFRYLDEEEVAAQRKAAQVAKAGKAAKK